ncbi:uncharacterized protein LOC111100591 isoform X2 [Crassostrea virginica]
MISYLGIVVTKECLDTIGCLNKKPSGIDISVDWVLKAPLQSHLVSSQSSTMMLSILLMFVCTYSGTADKACYQGWSFYADGCFKTFEVARPWREARAQCRLFPQGDLASFDSAADQHSVQTLVIRDTSEPYWIGLRGNTSSWKWTTGSDITSFSSFRDDAQITGQGSRGGDFCVELRNSLWSGVSCHLSRFYICQATTIDCQNTSGWSTTVSSHCIKAMTSQFNWYQGQRECRTMGADLASFHTKNELDFLSTNLSIAYDLYWIDLGTKAVHTANCEGINITKQRVEPFFASCSVQHRIICEISSCASRDDEYGCTTMFCISKSLLCDGRQDCPNGSDETSSLCDKTTRNLGPDLVTDATLNSSVSSDNSVGPLDIATRAILQCHRILTGIERKKCYRGKGNELNKFMRDFRPIENFTGSHNFSEIMKVYLDIYDAILWITANNGHFANVEYIMNISSVLESVERDLIHNNPHHDVYVEERENIVLQIHRNILHTNSKMRQSWNSSRQFLEYHMGHRINGEVVVDELFQGNMTLVVILIDKDVQERRNIGNVSDDYVRISPVLSISALKEGEYLNNIRHSFTLQHYSARSKNGDLTDAENRTVRCGFVDKETRLWSFEGCDVLQTTPSNTTCYCNHTTNFAILMQVINFEIEYEHQLALNIVTYIGCTISLVTQLIAITVFSCIPSLNSERTCVHKNLCFAITAAQLVFMTGIKAVHYKLVCSMVALVLHYFYSAVFVWMLVEGLLLYSKVVQVFGREQSRIVYYYAFGWGVPLLIVVISATSNWSGCWLSTSGGAIWAFAGPALSVIVVNVVILWLVIRIVIYLERKNEYRQIRSGVKAAIFLLPLLGLTWVFGLLAVNQYTIIFQYLFAIFNSLQGFFIFLFHCICNSEVRQAVKRMREKRLLSKKEFTNPSVEQNHCDITSSPQNGNARKLDKIPTRKIYPQRDMTSSTCISSKENTSSDNMKLEDVTPENDHELLFI